MAVFVVTTPDGQEFALRAGSENEALQNALSRLQIPFATFNSTGGSVRQYSSGKGLSDSDAIRRLNLPELGQTPLQTAGTTVKRTANTPSPRIPSTAQVNPITGQRLFQRPGDPNVIASQDRPGFPRIGAGQSQEFSSASTSGGANIPTLPFGSMINPDGSVSFGPSFAINAENRTGATGSGGIGSDSGVSDDGTTSTAQHPGLVFAKNTGGRILTDSNGIVVVELPDGSVYEIRADGIPRVLSGSSSSNGSSITPAVTPPAVNPLVERGAAEAELPAAAFRRFLRDAGVAPGGLGGQLTSKAAAPGLDILAALLGAFPDDANVQQLTFKDFFGKGGAIGPGRFSQLAQGALPGLIEALQANDPDFRGIAPGGTFTDKGQDLVNVARASSPVGGFGRRFLPSDEEIQRRIQDSGFATLIGEGGGLGPFGQFIQSQFRGFGNAGKTLDPRLRGLAGIR